MVPLSSLTDWADFPNGPDGKPTLPMYIVTQGLVDEWPFQNIMDPYILPRDHTEYGLPGIGLLGPSEDGKDKSKPAALGKEKLAGPAKTKSASLAKAKLAALVPHSPVKKTRKKRRCHKNSGGGGSGSSSIGSNSSPSLPMRVAGSCARRVEQELELSDTRSMSDDPSDIVFSDAPPDGLTDTSKGLVDGARDSSFGNGWGSSTSVQQPRVILPVFPNHRLVRTIRTALEWRRLRSPTLTLHHGPECEGQESTMQTPPSLSIGRRWHTLRETRWSPVWC